MAALLQSANPGDTLRFKFALLHWCGWQANPATSDDCWPEGGLLTGEHPDLEFLPIMQRRRLSPLARAACASAWRCRQACGDMPSIFFSRHGESRYYFEMLTDLARGEALSPSRFSLSVHNAIGGLYGLQCASRQPYLALAGGGDDVFAGLVEAAGLLLEVPRVLLVAYDQALPEVYLTHIHGPEQTWALAMVLANPGASGSALELCRTPDRSRPPSPDAGYALLQAACSGQLNGSVATRRALWQWRLTLG